MKQATTDHRARFAAAQAGCAWEIDKLTRYVSGPVKRETRDIAARMRRNAAGLTADGLPTRNEEGPAEPGSSELDEPITVHGD